MESITKVKKCCEMRFLPWVNIQCTIFSSRENQTHYFKAANFLFLKRVRNWTVYAPRLEGDRDRETERERERERDRDLDLDLGAGQITQGPVSVRWTAWRKRRKKEKKEEKTLIVCVCVWEWERIVSAILCSHSMYSQEVGGRAFCSSSSSTIWQL